MSLFKSSLAKIVGILFLGLLFFWLWIYFKGLTSGTINNLYGSLYPIIALVGAACGSLIVSKKWGGWNSVIGRGVLFLSLGLFGEVLGQWSWSYFTIIKQVEIPYPSVADVGYFSIIPFYGCAMYNFAKAAGVKINLSSVFGKIQAILVPMGMIAVAYFLFLKNVEIDLSNPLRTFLDFGYPGFEAIAVSIGILTCSLSIGVLGGKMRSKILFLVFALLVQYITDYTFLYQVGVGSYYNGGVVDLMYSISVTIMALGIFQFLETPSVIPPERS